MYPRSHRIATFCFWGLACICLHNQCLLSGGRGRCFAEEVVAIRREDADRKTIGRTRMTTLCDDVCLLSVFPSRCCLRQQQSGISTPSGGRAARRSGKTSTCRAVNTGRTSLSVPTAGQHRQATPFGADRLHRQDKPFDASRACRVCGTARLQPRPHCRHARAGQATPAGQAFRCRPPALAAEACQWKL